MLHTSPISGFQAISGISSAFWLFTSSMGLYRLHTYTLHTIHSLRTLRIICTLKFCTLYIYLRRPLHPPYVSSEPTFCLLRVYLLLPLNPSFVTSEPTFCYPPTALSGFCYGWNHAGRASATRWWVACSGPRFPIYAHILYLDICSSRLERSFVLLNESTSGTSTCTQLSPGFVIITSWMPLLPGGVLSWLWRDVRVAML